MACIFVYLPVIDLIKFVLLFNYIIINFIQIIIQLRVFVNKKFFFQHNMKL